MLESCLYQTSKKGHLFGHISIGCIWPELWYVDLCHMGPFTVANAFSSCGVRAQQLQLMGSLVGSVVEACGLSFSMGCGILVLWPEIEPAAPALQGGFLTTGTQGKSLPILDLNATITVLSRKNGRKIQLVIVTKHATQYYVMFTGYIHMEQKCKHIVMINTKFGILVTSE